MKILLVFLIIIFTMIICSAAPIYIKWEKNTIIWPTEVIQYDTVPDGEGLRIIATVVTPLAFEYPKVVAQSSFSDEPYLLGVVYETDGFTSWLKTQPIDILTYDEFNTLFKSYIQNCAKWGTKGEAEDVINIGIDADLQSILKNVKDQETIDAITVKYEAMIIEETK